MRFLFFSCWFAAALLQSCGYYSYPNRLEYPKVINPDYGVLKDYKAMFVSKFIGRDADRLRELLKQSLVKEDYYEVLDSFPFGDGLDETGLIEVNLEQVNFWEIKQNPDDRSIPVDIYQRNLTSVPIVVSNITLRFRFVIRNAETNEVVLDEPVEQSFQQYYIGEQQIAERPDADIESDRLSRLTFDRFAAKLNFDEPTEYLYYELGERDSFLTLFTGLTGNLLINKGIRLAQGKNYNDAVLSWMVKAYEPDADATGDLEKLDLYAINRASSLYNMGQTYRLLGHWAESARMFSLANQTRKRLHYAQAWADVIQIWKDSGEPRGVGLERLEGVGGGVSLHSPPDGQNDAGRGDIPNNVVNSFIFSEEQYQVQARRRLDERLILSPGKLWPFDRLEDEEKTQNEKSIIKE